MNCERAAKLLSAWIDGELSVPRAAEVQAHVADCGRCGHLAADLRQLRQVATELSDHELPPQLFAQSLAALRREAAATAATPHPQTIGWLRRALAAGLGLAAVAGLGLAIVLPTVAPRDRPVDAEKRRNNGGLAEGLGAKRPDAGKPVGPVLARGAESDEALLAAAGEEFRRAELYYRRAIDKLHVIAKRESARWPKGRRVGYQRVLAGLDAGVRRCRSAAELSPSDPKLQELLFSAYRRKLGYLQGAILGTLAGDGLPTLESLPPVGGSERL